MKQETSIWTEKYSPNSFDEYIWPETNGIFEKNINKFIKGEKDIKFLLLHGDNGTGKTTIINLIINKLKETKKVHVTKLNGSEQRGIDVVRNIIKPIVYAVANDTIRIIYIEESEKLTLDMQEALKDLMLDKRSNVRYFFTTNHKDKIIKDLISRFSSGIYEIKPLKKNIIGKYIVNILKKEKVEYDILHIKEVIDKTYPDIRKAINVINQHTIDNKFVLDEQSLKEMNFKTNIVDILANNKISLMDTVIKIRQTIVNNSITDYMPIVYYMYKYLDKITEDNLQQAVIISHLNDIQINDKDVYGKGKEINFTNGLIKIVNILKK